jgi:hypothetical protein
MVVIVKMSKEPTPFLELQSITLFGDVPTQTVGVVCIVAIQLVCCSVTRHCSVFESLSVPKLSFNQRLTGFQNRVCVFKTQTLAIRKKVLCVTLCV